MTISYLINAFPGGTVYDLLRLIPVLDIAFHTGGDSYMKFMVHPNGKFAVWTNIDEELIEK